MKYCRIAYGIGRLQKSGGQKIDLISLLPNKGGVSIRPIS